jgi:hypothetical protein
LLTVLLLAGCAAKQDIDHDPQAGTGDYQQVLVLTYEWPEDRRLTYRSTSQFSESSEMMGRTRSRTLDKTSEFTVQPERPSEGKHVLTFTVGSMTASVGMMGREMTRDLTEVIGKSFQMTLTPEGEQSILSGTEPLMYQLGPGGPRKLTIDFEGFFPNLPPGPVQTGDTWTSVETIADISGGDVTITLESVHTLSGFETINGLDCAKITTMLTGTLGGAATLERQMFNLEGTVSGRAVWYLSPEERFLVRSTRTIRTRGEVTQSGQKERAVPVTRELTVDTSLVF